MDDQAVGYWVGRLALRLVWGGWYYSESLDRLVEGEDGLLSFVFALL